MKGDRFEQLASDVFKRTSILDWEAITAKLLRKEFAAVQRMVVKHREAIGCNQSPFVRGQVKACHDMLAALDRRTKGGKS